MREIAKSGTETMLKSPDVTVGMRAEASDTWYGGRRFDDTLRGPRSTAASALFSIVSYATAFGSIEPSLERSQPVASVVFSAWRGYALIPITLDEAVAMALELERIFERSHAEAVAREASADRFLENLE